RPPATSTLFPYTTLFRSVVGVRPEADVVVPLHLLAALRPFEIQLGVMELHVGADQVGDDVREDRLQAVIPENRVLLHGVRNAARSEEHTSELQSRGHLVC